MTSPTAMAYHLTATMCRRDGLQGRLGEGALEDLLYVRRETTKGHPLGDPESVVLRVAGTDAQVIGIRLLYFEFALLGPHAFALGNLLL